MSNETKKCAHASCSCPVTDKKFCCQMCEDSADVTDLKCQCHHPGCEESL